MKYRLLSALPFYVVLYAVSLVIAFALRFDMQFTGEPLLEFLVWFPIMLCVKCAVFAFSREWIRRHRYTSLSDIVYVSASSLVASGLIYILNSFELILPGVHRSIILIDWVTTIMATSVLRSAVRLGIERIGNRRDTEKKIALIYGADRSSISLLRTIQVSVPEFKVVGLIDTTEKTTRSLIGGIRVVSFKMGIARIADKLKAGHLLIPGSVPGTVVRELCQECSDADLKAHVIPTLGEIVNGRVKLTVRDVTISDLLRREPTKLDMDGIESYIADRVVAVTGAAGSIGSELCRQIIQFKPAKLLLIDHSEFGMFQIEQEFLSYDVQGIELHFVIA
ncbi:MAG: polysaccharide biosynthesis protein, partial [Planctomycetes bacterium]|nr:polysaccharide biosynthesis protein [Planctomycetota bacterium]